jgi:LPXTG-site transpeptidase (sortase) family protein
MAAPSPSPDDTRPEPAGQTSRSSGLTLCAVAVVMVALNLIGGHGAPDDTARRPLADAAAGTAGQQVGEHLPRSKPLRLIIPEIFVDAPFTALAIDPTGRLEAPPADDVNLVGWYAEGASPGESGTAIIAGHVDTATSPAVFAGLGELEKGDTFRVTRADRRTATFVVDSAESFDKDDFPDRRVYGDTARAEVRLITCAGDYDRRVKDYTKNLVVFAHLI